MTAHVLLVSVVGCGVLGGALVAADMGSARARGRLDTILYSLLRVARLRLREEQRVPMHDHEWMPELHHILNGGATPALRLLSGTRYAVGLIRKAHNVGEIRSGRDLRGEPLHRFVATADACNVFGNLFTSAAYIVLTSLIGLAAGFQLTESLGVSGHKGRLDDMPLAVTLIVVFTLLLGGALALLVGLALLGIGPKRLYRPPHTLWSTPELKPHHGLVVVVSRHLLDWIIGEDGDNARGVPTASLLGAGAGVGLGIFTERSMGQMADVFLILGGLIAIFVMLRITLVELLLWRFERQRPLDETAGANHHS
ncbi:hypothetical protein E1200_28220 [Actinomadura sp. GC306]|uniref:hypothetical protein n=1 Tax=Actinomadura sp. GC306 TaxID=2530367 RepID=UPI001044EDA1|nr:hypothetical protein [Actinomadura sp. GC306]TDC61759.1 hypothetical protein E1200_28220 [Actinomadura sp. GC306]